MYRLLFSLSCILFLFACNEPQETKTIDKPKVEKTDAPVSKQEAFENLKGELSTSKEVYDAAEKLPSIQLYVLKNLWENADYVDYLYYDLPISASLDNKGAIQSAVAHVAEQPAAKIPNCKPIGRVFYQIKGENVLQGDIFFSKGCTYFLWVDKKGGYYAGNLMMDSALKFFASNIQAARGSIR